MNASEHRRDVHQPHETAVCGSQMCDRTCFLRGHSAMIDTPLATNWNNLMLSIKKLFCAAILLLAAPVFAQELRKDYSAEDVREMLLADGFRAVDVEGDNTLRIKVNGLTYILTIQTDGDLLLYFGMTGYNVNTDIINGWNARMRLTRAYIDSENDPVLESDLLANAGYTSDHVIQFVSVFDQFAREYRSFLNENNLPEAPVSETL